MDSLQIGGKGFRLITGANILHDITLKGILRAAKLDVAEILEEDYANDEAVAVKLMSQLSDAGKLGDFLGCLVIPVQHELHEWTTSICKKTGEFLLSLTDQDDKELLMLLANNGLAAFFRAGLCSLKISRKSSEASTSEAGPNPTTPSTSARSTTPGAAN